MKNLESNIHNNVCVSYVLGSRFPTEKAYGVTCTKTVLEIGKQKIKTKIFSFTSGQTDDFVLPLTELHAFHEKFIARKLRIFGTSGKNKLHQIAWKISLLSTIKGNVDSTVVAGTDFVWLRDPDIAYEFLKKSNLTVILEVHTRISLKKMSKLEKYNDRLVYCPISKQTLNNIHKHSRNTHIVFSPMAIDSANLASELQIKKNVEKFLVNWDSKSSIGYVGKFSPNGYSKGVEDLIALALLLRDRNSNMTVTLVGGTSKEVEELTRVRTNLGLSPSKLKIIGHLNHEKAIKSLEDFDILVLPGARNINYDGMPLKTLEYLSSGKIVVVADTLNHKQIFDESYQPKWYTAGDASSLFKSIFSCSDKSVLINSVTKGIQFAAKFTWEDRTKNIIEYAKNLDKQRVDR